MSNSIDKYFDRLVEFEYEKNIFGNRLIAVKSAVTVMKNIFIENIDLDQSSVIYKNCEKYVDYYEHELNEIIKIMPISNDAINKSLQLIFEGIREDIEQIKKNVGMDKG